MSDLSKTKALTTPKLENAGTWQDRLLPLMVMMIVGMTLFFLVASIMQLESLNSAIQDTPKLDLSKIIESQTKTTDERADVRLRAYLTLEANIIDRRHHEASVSLMARIWTRYMGFITGMTLSMIGAAFILGRLSSGSSALSGEMGGIAIELQSASPGLFMIVLGAVLMIVTITNHPRINVVDRAVFVTPIEGANLPELRATSDDSEIENKAPPRLPDWPNKE